MSSRLLVFSTYVDEVALSAGGLIANDAEAGDDTLRISEVVTRDYVANTGALFGSDVGDYTDFIGAATAGPLHRASTTVPCG